MVRRLTAIFTVVVVLFGSSIGFAEDSEPSAPARHGRALAERMCARCHAIGRNGSSPHSAAPAFRTLDRRLALDAFMDQLREGLSVGHPDMPMFRFTPEDARALLFYLRSIEAQ